MRRARAQPRTRHQAAHAVRDDHRRESGGRLDAVDGALHQRDVLVEAGEHRLQADRDERAVELEQALHPRVPQAPVADVAVDEHHAAQPARGVGQVILDRVGAPGHAPAEDGGRGHPLAQERTRQVAPAGRGRAVGGGHAAGHQHLDGQQGRMTQHQRVENDPAAGRPARHPFNGQQGAEQGEPGNEQQSSDAGQHAPSITHGRSPRTSPARMPQPDRESRLIRLPHARHRHAHPAVPRRRRDRAQAPGCRAGPGRRRRGIEDVPAAPLRPHACEPACAPALRPRRQLLPQRAVRTAGLHAARRAVQSHRARARAAVSGRHGGHRGGARGCARVVGATRHRRVDPPGRHRADAREPTCAPGRPPASQAHGRARSSW